MVIRGLFCCMKRFCALGDIVLLCSRYALGEGGVYSPAGYIARWRGMKSRPCIHRGAKSSRRA